MLLRYTTSLGTATAVTCGLLLLMQGLIGSREAPLINAKPPQIVDYLRVIRTPPPARQARPRPPETPQRPPERIVDGQPVEVHGVSRLIRFVLEP